jgi:LAO/AO transport system kinase
LAKSRTRSSLSALLRRTLNHDRRAIAQLMSLAENDPKARVRILSSLYPRTGKAYVIGITGPLGSGKSSLITALAKAYRKNGYSVGIVAVDPTSHASGGALLGDRIRMGELASDPKVFIRSMATRGRVGGVARATEDVIRILDASSMDYIIVETVGAGQSDLDIKTLVDTTVVVMTPGLGDEIQAMKAGIMEIGDIFVVNKADRENADATAQEIRSVIMMSEPVQGWRPSVLKTNALSGEGAIALTDAINEHAQHLRNSGVHERLSEVKLRREVLDEAKRYFEDTLLQVVASGNEFERLLAQVRERKMSPHAAARRLLRSTRMLKPA